MAPPPPQFWGESSVILSDSAVRTLASIRLPPVPLLKSTTHPQVCEIGP
ncbi:hypothetical protein AM1_2254 [Acaryochloris marina MBIC11017]|uniref:Uncharacterized protein n=1 Tax=Acaryochloris marina (strain MBIC 11017) TaxID=329726 RepID=B0C108_ACAM1|nr:hypothetical protein AM1_2254 [Acaryochloris marina MBIC11017]